MIRKAPPRSARHDTEQEHATEAPGTRLEDLYDERSNQRLLLVVRALLVCSTASILTPIPGLYVGPPMAGISAMVMAALVMLSGAYVAVLVAAHRQRWRLARNLLFAAWSVYPSSLVLSYHPEIDGIVQALVLGLADLFAVLVLVAMVALAPWRQARLWMAALFASMSGSFAVVWFAYEHTSVAGYLSFVGVTLALLSATALPLWAIFSDLDRALRANDAARREAQTLREEAAQARDEAIAANRAKSRFLANMSHELRTPLNAILGYAQLVAEEAQELGHDGFEDDLQRIQTAGIHLLGLIDSVLDLSKIEAGKTEVHREWFHAGDLVADTVATVHPLATQKGLAITTALTAAGAAYTDPRKLRQVLINLLSNAVKYTEHGSVSVVATMAEGWLTIDVTDTGLGIEPARLDAVFEAFERTEAEVTRRVGGTGLGLAISRRICEALDGTLSVVSAVNQGSTFSIRVPATAASTSPPSQF